MQRRRLLMMLAPTLAWPGAWAEHGWKPYADRPPIYLEGEVTIILWSDPHPHLELLQRRGARVPPELARSVLRHRGPVDAAQLVGKSVPAPDTERTWRVELPPLHRIVAWGMDRPKRGEVVGVIGLLGPPVAGTPAMQAEILFTGDKGYPLRADPL